MSLAIAPIMSAAASLKSAACACGTCAACAPRRVAEATPEPVSGTTGSRVRADRFEASGLAPASEEQVADGTAGDEASEAEEATSEETAAGPGRELSPDERRMVAELRARDREVRAHEAAHKAAGGAHVGGASYTYQQGPDGQQYAIGGEVPVDLSTSGGSPEAIIAKMEQVRAAALAPGDPSPQDYAVAAAADALAAEARRDLQKQESKNAEETAAKKTEGSSSGLTGLALATPAEPVAGAPNGSANGRALAAYRQAQDTQAAQALIDQRV